MNPAELRDHCLSFTGAGETFSFGPETSVFKVAGKMFALSQLSADSLRVSLKCEPELAAALRRAYLTQALTRGSRGTFGTWLKSLSMIRP
jgi:predicted DNA-binding protein (MmcQ/YjbR family)